VPSAERGFVAAPGHRGNRRLLLRYRESWDVRRVDAGPVVTARNAAYAEDAMKSWGVLPSDNTVCWVILWIVMTAFFVGVAWFIMEVIDYYIVLPARTAFAIWVGLSWLLVWQVGARIAAHERRRFGRS